MRLRGSEFTDQKSLPSSPEDFANQVAQGSPLSGLLFCSRDDCIADCSWLLSSIVLLHGCSRRSSLQFFQRCVHALLEISFVIVAEAAEGCLDLHFAAFGFGVQNDRVDALAGESSSDVEGGGQIFVVNADNAVLP